MLSFFIEVTSDYFKLPHCISSSKFSVSVNMFLKLLQSFTVDLGYNLRLSW